MINPTEKDIGRKVVYTGNRYPGGKLEEGVITSFNDHCVFVRYRNGSGSQGTSREDLEWITPADLSRQIAALGIDSLLPPERKP